MYLAKQIDLWRKATGRPTGFPVHVCYVVNPTSSRRTPRSRKDLNDAQKDAVEIWYGNKAERAIDDRRRGHQAAASRSSRYAHGETVQMLPGCSDEQIDTLIVQLKINKEFGFLKSDIWDSPDRIRRSSSGEAEPATQPATRSSSPRWPDDRIGDARRRTGARGSSCRR